MALKVGDVVILKSGGPPMTVNFIHENSVDCVWFMSGELKNGTFDKESVKINESTF